jgi:phosphatidylglycerophosphate synthase
MRDAALRRQKDRWLEPLAMRWTANIHPNWISLAAMLVGLVGAVAVWQGMLWLGLLLWLINRTLDGLDGVVARKFGKQSDFGGYLDLALDYVVYLAVPLAFVAAAPSPALYWAALFLISSYVLNLMSWSVLSAILEKRRWQAKTRQTTIEMPPGLIEGAETIAFYTLFFLLPGQVAWLFGLMALLVFFTAGQRIWWAYRHVG